MPGPASTMLGPWNSPDDLGHVASKLRPSCMKENSIAPRVDAIKTLEIALEMSGEVGHGFTGPRIVGEIARNLVETEAKCAAFGERRANAGGGFRQPQSLRFLCKCD